MGFLKAKCIVLTTALFVLILVSLFKNNYETENSVKIYIKDDMEMNYFEARNYQMEYLNINKWHEEGYKGKGITIMNAEDDEGHGESTRNIIEKIAPEATIISQRISISVVSNTASIYCNVDGSKIPLEQFIIDNKVDIITASLASRDMEYLDYDDAITEEFMLIRNRTGCVFFNASGNEGSYGIRTKFPLSTCISVGATDSQVTERVRYSGIGSEVDFIAPTFGESGTSFACPTVASMSALLMQRYGKMSHYKLYDKLIELSTDIEDKGFDFESGWGVPILPSISDDVIELQIGSKSIFLNGAKSEMDVAPFIKDSRTFVPIRFVSEALDCDVEWIDETKTVLIKRRK